MVVLARKERFGYVLFSPEDFSHELVAQEDFPRERRDVLLGEETNHRQTPGILKAPIRVYFDLTRKCNLYCKTCVNDSRDPLSDELGLDEYLKIIENLRKSEVFDLRFTGGEVTVVPGWETILQYAKSQGFVFSMNTNGIFNNRTRDAIARIMPDEVSVSLDGGPEINDMIRGRGTYRVAAETIRYLHEQGIKVTVNSVLTAHSHEKDLEALMSDLGSFCDDMSFFHGRPVGRGYSMREDMLDFDGMIAINKILDQIRGKYRAEIRTNSPTLFKNAMTRTKATKLGLMVGGSDGFTRFNIFPDGHTFAGGCAPYVDKESYTRLSTGNVREFDYAIDDIWHGSSKLWEQRGAFAKFQERCEDCEAYKQQCSGFTVEMEEYRNIRGVNPFCIQ